MSLFWLFNCCKSKRYEPIELEINIQSDELILSDLVKVTENNTQINNPSLKLKKINIQNLSRKKQPELIRVDKQEKILKINKNISFHKLKKIRMKYIIMRIHQLIKTYILMQIIFWVHFYLLIIHMEI